MSEEETKQVWDNLFQKLNEEEKTYLAVVNNEKNKEIERLNNIINETKEEINQYKTLIETGVKGNCKKIYKQEALNILEMILLSLGGDGRKVMNNEVLNDLLYVLSQLDGYLDKGWTIDLNFTDIREKYKKDIEDYENWD